MTQPNDGGLSPPQARRLATARLPMTRVRLATERLPPALAYGRGTSPERLKVVGSHRHGRHQVIRVPRHRRHHRRGAGAQPTTIIATKNPRFTTSIQK